MAIPGKGRNKLRKGFTLIELLIVIAIIVALSVTVFVTLNPIGRLAAARDSRRTADIEIILTTIHDYMFDNKGSLPPGMSTSMTDTMLGTGVSGCNVTQSSCSVSASACLNLTTPLAKYTKNIPVDPGATYSAALTGYAVSVDANNKVTVKACGTEGSTAILLSR